MFIVVSYDVNTKHFEFKQKMKEKGYIDYWSYGHETYFLPSTTLWKKEGSTSKAKKDLQESAESLGIRLERGMALEVNLWEGIPGKPF